MNIAEDYDLANPNDIENEANLQNIIFTSSLKSDRGLNIIYRNSKSNSGKKKSKPKRSYIFTSDGVGNKIRDAETGEYYPNKIGSRDEDLFYKVALATGECRSLNGSNILFYLSPQNCMNHLHCVISESNIAAWELKRNKRLSELNIKRKPENNFIIIN